MLLLVSGSTRSVLKYPEVGRFIVPRAGNHPKSLNLEPGKWAMDNGAFKKFDVSAFVRMLKRFYGQPGCLFVAAPDVVGDAKATLELWPFWSRLIRGLGYPVAFVAQDGLTVESAPWSEMNAFFLGGTTKFKLSQSARTLCAYATARGLWLHVGRVNSHRRLRFINQIGANSYDGTSTSRYGNVHIPKRLRSVRELREQPELSL